jgi:hypothetical protein
MSHAAIEQGIIKTIRDHFNDLQGKWIGPSPPNMQPPPAFGQWYVGVAGATSNPGPATSGDVQDEVYTVQIGITFRASVTPYDRLGWMTHKAAANTPNFASSSSVAGDFPTSINQMGSTVASLLRKKYAVINNANGFIEGFDTTANGFIEPFHQVTVGPVQDKPASWVHSNSDTRTGEITFLIVTATGARRCRIVGEQDEFS